MGKIYFAIGIHNHQPVGNFDGVFEDAFKRAYLPFLKLASRHPKVKFSLHNSGPLHEWLQEHHPEHIDRLHGMADDGQVEILGGGFYEPILTILPEEDRIGQVTKYAEHLDSVYGKRPAGVWLAERVWEQFLALSLSRSGVSYTMLDDTHFKNAGLTDEQLLGYYTTEHEGGVIKVFPISEQLRYLIPFRTVEDVIVHLKSLVRDGREQLVVYADDGEKFGTWPGTHKHVYKDGWLERLFEAIEENSSWLETIHFEQALDKLAPLGRIYLPDASYREMGEWVLENKTRERYDQLVDLLKDRGVFDLVSFCIRGGTWRNFRMKYPEALRMYAKMIEVSRLVNSGSFANQDEAIMNLYRGQCNCAYWHGVFGGLYLPHLRTAIYENLISAENIARTSKSVTVEEADFDLDGVTEIKLSNKSVNLYLKPDAGGHLYELDFTPIKFNLLNTVERRVEYYHREVHAKLDNPPSDTEVPSIHEISADTSGLEKYLLYDRYPRVALIDHLLAPGFSPETLASCEYSEISGTSLSRRKYRIDREKGLVEMTSREVAFTQEGDREFGLVKTIELSGEEGDFKVEYCLENAGKAGLQADFAIELNFAMLSDRDPAKWYFNGEGDKIGTLGDTADLGTHEVFGIRDERIGLQIRVKAEPQARVIVHPVYSVNHSESGFEKVFQCCAAFVIWPIDMGKDSEVKLSMDVHVGKI